MVQLLKVRVMGGDLRWRSIIMHVRRSFVYVATLRQPKLVLCTSLPHCSPCSTAAQLLGAHPTALSSRSDADGRYHTVVDPEYAILHSIVQKGTFVTVYQQ